MLEKISNYNKEMLIWARKDSHIPFEEVKEHFENVEEWEKGSLYPNYSELKKLANYYKKPLAIFFFPEIPDMKNIKLSCRTLPREVYNELSPAMIRMINYARAMQLNLYELFDGKNPNPIFKALNNDISYDELRDILDFSYQKQYKQRDSVQMFKYLRDAVAELGVHVFKNAFKDDTVSGLCLYDEEFPVILINNTTSASRQCFTLVHELYHIFSATSGVDFRSDEAVFYQYQNDSSYQAELNCNLFAAKFFVSDEELKINSSITIEDKDIETLSKKFNVSREVIARRLYEINKITYNELQDFIEQYIGDWFSRTTKNGKGGDYYATQSSYFGDSYLLTVYHQYYSNKIDALKVSQYLNMSITNASKLAIYKGWGEIR